MSDELPRESWKVLTKSRRGGWREMVNRRRFPSEQAAWDFVASLDQDGIIDRINYRVVIA